MKDFLGLVYISEATTEFNLKDLYDLSEQAAKKNKQLGITGYLYFEKNNFLQYLEGEKSNIHLLMDNIAKDERHEIINVLEKDSFSSRKFPSWNMQYLTQEMLVKTKMETLIINRMNYLKKVNQKITPQQIEEDTLVWEMIDKLSSYLPLLLK